MTIGPDLRTVVILRTITAFDVHQMYLEEEQRYLSTVPDLNHSERFRNACPSNAIMPTLPYEYEWLFSPDSLFAVFREWDLGKAHGSIAVFRLRSCVSRIESVLVKHLQFDGYSDTGGLRLCAIHPLEQKLLLLNKDTLFFINLEHGKFSQI